MRRVKQGFKRIVTMGVSCIVIALLIVGCSRKVTWISLDPKSIELNKLGQTFQIKSAALDKENKPVTDAVLTWTSSRPEVAEVSNTGLLTAKGTGNSLITAFLGKEKAVVQCKVSILSAIKVEPAQLEIKIGEKKQLEAAVLNEKGEPYEDQVVGWASSDNKIVFVDDLGEITGIAPGEATVIATTPGKGLTNTYGNSKITVK